MNQYLILLNPGHNRVYFQALKKIALAELSVALGRMDLSCREPELTEIAEVPYLSFTTETALGEQELLSVARLSSCYAFFSADSADQCCRLTPIPLPHFRYLDENVSTILKYTGKTN